MKIKLPHRSIHSPLYLFEKMMWNIHSKSWDCQLTSIDYNEGLERVANEFGKIPGGSRQSVVDLGCGTGNFGLAVARKDLDITCVDFASKMLEKAKVKFAKANIQATFRKADFNKPLPFVNQQFNHAMCIAALQCVVSPLAFLVEINRIIKPGGIFIGVFRDPTSNDNRVYKNEVKTSFFTRALIHFKLSGNKTDWVQQYTGELFQQYLYQSGFSVVRMEPFYPQTLMVVAVAK